MKGVIIFDESKRMTLIEIFENFNYQHTLVKGLGLGNYIVYAVSENLNTKDELKKYMDSLNNPEVRIMNAYNKNPNAPVEI